MLLKALQDPGQTGRKEGQLVSAFSCGLLAELPVGAALSSVAWEMLCKCEMIEETVDPEHQEIDWTSSSSHDWALPSGYYLGS